MASEVKIGMVGYKFMGKAHSNAYHQAARFFDLPMRPVLQVACGRHEDQLDEFAEKWGWQQTETSWERLVERDDVDMIDISSPTHTHKDIAIAAARSGKHILCEKPMALDASQARAMYEAAKSAGVRHAVGFNYRRVPAIRFAKRLIEEGRIGRIFHWRGAYLQDWIVDPNFPLTWQLRKETAGYGPHGDLNSHSVDLARYLVGEIKSVQCTMTNFISQRSLPDEANETAFDAAAAQGQGRASAH